MVPWSSLCYGYKYLFSIYSVQQICTWMITMKYNYKYNKINRKQKFIPLKEFYKQEKGAYSFLYFFCCANRLGIPLKTGGRPVPIPVAGLSQYRWPACPNTGGWPVPIPMEYYALGYKEDSICSRLDVISLQKNYFVTKRYEFHVVKA